MKFIYFLLLSIIDSYKYLTLYNWKTAKKLLINENAKDKIRTHIYNDYKNRTINKITKYLKNTTIDDNKLKLFYMGGLLGLKESINTYNSTIKYNFAKYSDIKINKNLNIILKHQIYTKKKNIIFNKKNNNYVWWKSYWNYINNDLQPVVKKIIKSKYTYNFKQKKTNNELALMYNTTSNNITDIITSSLSFIHKKIHNEYLLGERIITNNIFF